MLGISIPPPRVEITESGGATGTKSNRGTIVISGTVVTALAGVVVAAMQMRSPPSPPTQDQGQAALAALQARVDTVQAEQTQLKRCIRLLGEAVCALNEGPMGSGWDECPPHVYRDNRHPPPLHRTDRVYADCMELLR